MNANGRTLRRVFCLHKSLLALWLVTAGLSAQDTALPDEADEPTIRRLEPTPPKQAAKTLSALRGFRADLIAHEPLLRDPVAITYDENGAMYAVEMTAYPHPDRSDHPAPGQIRMLLDDDSDGDFDSSFVFADQLSTPTSAICWKGGVFVLAPPDLWYLKDTDGDHRADVRQKIYTGFGINNAETLANNLKWGIDNKIHGASSHSGGTIRSARDPQQTPVAITGRDFCFQPVTGAFEPLTWATSRWGNSFDDSYNRFVCQNTGPARHVVLPLRYLARNPYLSVDTVYQSLAKEVGTEPVYRASPPEPWRVVRAFRRQSLGKPANPGEINAAGYFTASCGITVYRGAAYPQEFRGNLFVGDAAGNLVHRRTVTPRGVTFDSQRADKDAEFLASTDNFFRPVNFINAPDGTLHVVDMYREVVEGPSWVPDDLKQKGLVDVHGGSDRGRIYRLSPPGFEVPAPPRLGGATSRELVRQLQNPNSWWRETAQRLLVERQDRTVVDALQGTLTSAPSDVARLHALWTLEGLSALSDAYLNRALSDNAPRLREHAVRIAEPRLIRPGHSKSAATRSDASRRALAKRICFLHQDRDARVRLQVAFTLGQIDDDRAVDCLARIAASDKHDSWFRTALLSSSYARSNQLLQALIDLPAVTEDSQGIELLKSVAFVVGSRNRPKEMSAALSTIGGATRDTALQISLLAAFLRSGRQTTLASQAPKLVAGLLPAARRMVSQDRTPMAQRTDAVLFLGLDKTEPQHDLLASLIAADEPEDIQRAAVRTLASFPQTDVPRLLIRRRERAAPAVRNEIVERVAANSAWVPVVLEAVEQGRLPAGEISAARRAQVMKHADAAIRERARSLLADEVLGARNDVIAAYKVALGMPGDVQRGKQIFVRECTVCHRFGKQGHDVGPNLSAYGRKALPPASLMAQILDPNREISADFMGYVVLLTDGRIETGIMATQTPSSITLKKDKGTTVTLLRRDIEEIKNSGKSLMPEGFEKKLNHQQMADLLAFLAAVNQRI